MPATQKQRTATREKTPTRGKRRKKGKAASRSRAATQTKTRKKTAPKRTTTARKTAPAATTENKMSPELIESTESTELPPDSAVTEAIEDSETSGVQAESPVDISEQATNILSIIEGLEGQVDTAFKLKEVLESDLSATRERLSEELALRTDLEMRLNVLESQTVLADQLREDISFAEEERNKFANLVEEIQPQLEAMTEQRDLLSEEATAGKASIKKLEGERTTLEAQVMNLKDKISDTENLRTQVAEQGQAFSELQQQARDLANRLGASETSKDTLGTDLRTAQEKLRVMGTEAENWRQKEIGTGRQLTDLQAQLEEQQAVNTNLVETVGRLESEMRTASINSEAVEKELQAAKKALHEICNEASRTSGRVRQRYFNANK